MMTEVRYIDRRHAGQAVAHALRRFVFPADTVVLGVPRGGVPVAVEVARALELPLDVFLARKIGLPSQPDLAMGALAAGGLRLFDNRLIHESGLSAGDIEEAVQMAERELQQGEARYRGHRPALDLHAGHVILVDDGLATGLTLRAAARALRERGVVNLTVVVPVGARDSCAELARHVELLVCPFTPEPFGSVDLWYSHFEETTDEEVRDLLAHSVTPAA